MILISNFELQKQDKSELPELRLVTRIDKPKDESLIIGFSIQVEGI
ncbi:hypothetical protein [Mastigocoleus sp. MO_188.B34]|nr:hypothetical protein [Mastigocoleus sp. MO_188.B34]